MARQLPSEARPRTPGFGPVLVPPDFSDMSAVSFQPPSSIWHARPSLRGTLVTAVPWPMDGRRSSALALRSRTVLMCSLELVKLPYLLHSRLRLWLDYG